LEAPSVDDGERWRGGLPNAQGASRERAFVVRSLRSHLFFGVFFTFFWGLFARHLDQRNTCASIHARAANNMKNAAIIALSAHAVRAAVPAECV
jgi:hypothetical protein